MRPLQMARVLLAVPALTLAIVLALALAAAPAEAQLPSTCLNCSFTLSVVDWNGTAAPGGLANGTLRIENTGQTADTYSITVTADNDTWVVQVSAESSGELPPGAGLFASEENTFDFGVSAIIPDAAGAGATTGLTVTVSSDNMADDDAEREQTQPLTATASQIFGWDLTCTDQVRIMKTETGIVHLNATNLGNGRDQAAISHAPLEGLAITDLASLNAAAGATVSQEVTLGVGLTLDDKDYKIRWDLRRTGDATTLASCTTTLTVTGGTGTNDDGGTKKDSPAVPLGPTLVVLGVAVALARRRVRA